MFHLGHKETCELRKPLESHSGWHSAEHKENAWAHGYADFPFGRGEENAGEQASIFRIASRS
jgi:hypothetical protein